MDIVKIGQVGGHGGNVFPEKIIPDETRICEIHIKSGAFVDSIHIFYEDDTKTKSLTKIGGDGGELYVFSLEKDEYITGFSGRYGNYIDGIQIHTNKRKSPYIGGDGGDDSFMFLAAENNEIVGIFGRQSWYVDALGVVTRPLTIPTIKTESTASVINNTAVDKPAKEKKAKLNLVVINGIGPRTNRLLANNNIIELADLANANVETLRTILNEAGAGFQKYDPSTWVDEANTLIQSNQSKE